MHLLNNVLSEILLNFKMVWALPEVPGQAHGKGNFLINQSLLCKPRNYIEERKQCVVFRDRVKKEVKGIPLANPVPVTYKSTTR